MGDGGQAASDIGVTRRYGAPFEVRANIPETDVPHRRIAAVVDIVIDDRCVSDEELAAAAVRIVGACQAHSAPLERHIAELGGQGVAGAAGARARRVTTPRAETRE